MFIYYRNGCGVSFLLNFVICDDTHSESIRDAIEPIIDELNIGKIVMTEKSPDKVMEYIKNNKVPTAYFLDIELNSSINGIDMARLIREKDSSSYIVFITAYEKFAFLTYKYKLNVVDYIVKPVNKNDVIYCIETICNLEKDKKFIEDDEDKKDYILNIKSGWKQYRIDARDIIYIEVIKNKIIIHIETGQISFFSTLKDVRDKLPSVGVDSIMICHKSYMVNIKKISCIDKNDVIMINGDRCPLSRRYKRGIVDAFNS